MNRWHDRTLSATYVLVVAGLALVALGLAGIEASGPPLAVLLATGAVLSALRPKLAQLPNAAGYRVGRFARDIWLAPVVAVAFVWLIAPNASAGEMQSIGGIAGFLGMVNYFVRPVYLYAAATLRGYVPTGKLT